MTNTIVYTNEFIFNEVEFFRSLLDNEEKATLEQKEEILNSLNLENINYKFIYKKDSKGNWYKHCYKGNDRITWNHISNWMRPHIWDFDRENNIFMF